ncbi:hypothetical protein Patl1_29614 [Pistacia atlantica]|uniref:Uncharacterized protein n=1 Tax=Pistacia atlantica TaxID=434234 RepID=A0ACC1AB43_9ROSI|nr:hypothetical protein Patl1_29614 [Pistacia atlantica]
MLAVCTSRDNNGWGRRISDIIVFHGWIYVVDCACQIGIFNLRSCDLRFLELKFAPRTYYGKWIRLVASNDQLFVIIGDSLEVYRIDLSRMEWAKVCNLGDQALFHSYNDMMCSKVINPSKWGGQTNCRYGLRFSSKTCNLSSFNREKPRSAITIDMLWIGDSSRYASTKIYSWYCLNQSSSTDNVRDSSWVLCGRFLTQTRLSV